MSLQIQRCGYTPRPRMRNRRAFLLVEATLTAVVIAVGLVFISRGLSESLRIVSRLQESDRLLRIAESTLSELEIRDQHQPLATSQGSCEPPDDQYQWSLAISPVQSTDPSLQTFRAVILTVHRADLPTPAAQLSVLWPGKWSYAE